MAFTLALVPPAVAAPEDVANRISGEVMSPFCPGVTLHECPTRQAEDLRERIKVWATQGWSEPRIMSELETEYGPGIYATPPTDGGGIVAWLLPGMVAIGGLLLAGTLARRWSSSRELEIGSTTALEPSVAIGPAQSDRLEREISAREAQLSGGGRP